MNAVRAGLLACSATYTEKHSLKSPFARSFDWGKPTHIYKKRDFGNEDSTGKRILLVLYNRLYIATGCDYGDQILTRTLVASRP
jgi:hypothetical protein